ncbi:60Kd inner membrane protein-domain-containing protein [Ampelomyces quisqualis]|uniref:60Kd inner membrane protein-domain-containing protein n=1 Tax=Ampelomyces quisqualis TaxID=50730 RepID=A0A6A5R2A6_AMPQU|nr:60Kd inner membrane protein-domain-containing protein [Ampelomyces quisqualis]
MSPALVRRPARQLLSPWSAASPAPRCRTSLRSLHASAPRQDPVLDAVLYLPHEMMNVLHAGVPWYAALPLTAFLTRALLVTTAGAWARSLTARYVGLHPLRQALAFRNRDELMQRGGFRSPQEATVAVKKQVKEETAKLDQRWNVTLTGQISWTFAQIPIFFAIAEAIRQKCGARDGLLGLGFSFFKGEEAQTTVGDMAVTTSQWFEPGLANEGMLWFQDLLLPDPTGTLPFVVSGLMFANIYLSKNTVEEGASWTRTIRRVLLGVSLLVGPLCQGLPAAMMLYWASSTSSVMLWNIWLDWRYPAPRGFTACKRPLQMPPKPLPRERKLR